MVGRGLSPKVEETDREQVMHSDNSAALADGKACLDAALRYLDRGWSILALCPPDHMGIRLVSREHGKSCKSPGKRPWYEWKPFQERLPTKQEILDRWRQLPNSNVGGALGPVSQLLRVDVEGQAGEQLLNEKSKGDLPPTLAFRSGRKDGTGRGLLYGIPRGVTLRTTIESLGQHSELRFQAQGAQTVLPPSRHKDGGLYLWEPGHGIDDGVLHEAPDWLIAELQASARKECKARSGDDWEEIFAGTSEGARNDSMTQVAGKLLRALGDLDSTSDLQAAWLSVCAVNEQNSPPLEEGELRTIFRSIHRAEKARREKARTESLDRYIETTLRDSCPPPAEPTDPEQPPQVVPTFSPPWHLVIYHGTPSHNLLRSPLWSASPQLFGKDGYIKLEDDEICHWAKIILAAWVQAKVRVPNRISDWPATLNQLVAHAQHLQTVADARRYTVLAGFVLAQLRRAEPVLPDDQGKLIIGRGAPVLWPDGSIRVKFDWLLTRGQRLAEPVKRPELLEVIQNAGLLPFQYGPKNARERWWSTPPSAMAALEQAAGLGNTSPDPVLDDDNPQNGVIPDYPGQQNSG